MRWGAPPKGRLPGRTSPVPAEARYGLLKVGVGWPVAERRFQYAERLFRPAGSRQRFGIEQVVQGLRVREGQQPAGFLERQTGVSSRDQMSDQRHLGLAGSGVRIDHGLQFVRPVREALELGETLKVSASLFDLCGIAATHEKVPEVEVRFRQGGRRRNRRFEPPGGFIRIGGGREGLAERRQTPGELFGARRGFFFLNGRRQHRDRLGASLRFVEKASQTKPGSNMIGIEPDGLPVGPLGCLSFLEVVEHVTARELRFGIVRGSTRGLGARLPGLLQPLFPRAQQAHLEQDARIARPERECGFEMRSRQAELPEFGIERPQMVARLEGIRIRLRCLLECCQAIRCPPLLDIQHTEGRQHLGPPRILPAEVFQPSHGFLPLPQSAEQDGQIPVRFGIARFPGEDFPESRRRLRESPEGGKRARPEQRTGRALRNQPPELFGKGDGLGKVPQPQPGDREHPERIGIRRVGVSCLFEVWNGLCQPVLGDELRRDRQRVCLRRQRLPRMGCESQYSGGDQIAAPAAMRSARRFPSGRHVGSPEYRNISGRRRILATPGGAGEDRAADALRFLRAGFAGTTIIADMTSRFCRFQRLLAAFFVLGMLGSSLAGAQEELSEKEKIAALPERHRVWLAEEVAYIITDREKRVFLTLTSEAQRDSFVGAFWRKRDHNPSTPENEFQIEHYERFDYVNKWFGRSTFREGWETDRGRYYILAGPPRTIQNFEARDEIYPTELWFYNNSELKRLGLPPFFYLLFWRRHGIGELQLYDPISDGPQALLTGYQPERQDFRDEVERAYEILYEFDPEIANAAMSFRTDEQDITRFQAVPFGSMALVADIHEAPFRGLDDSYADRLDFERGAIEADYLFTYVPGRGAVAVLPGPENASFLHWVVEVDAQYTAFIRNEDRSSYDTAFIGTVEAVLRDDPEQIVTEFRRESFISLTDEEARGTLQRPFSWSGVLPLIPGDHTVRIVLRNRACASRDEEDCTKSYTLVETDVSVPARDGSAQLSDLVLGRRIQAARLQYRPFRIGSAEVVPNPQGVYAIGDDFIAAAAPESAPEGATVRFRIVSREPLTDGEVTYEDEQPAIPDAASGFVALDFSLLDIGPGRYELQADLLDRAAGVLSSRRAEFSVSPRGNLLEAGFRGTMLPFGPENPGLTSLALGEQLMALERTEEARPVVEKAVAMAPRLGRARELLARLEIDAGNPAKVVDLLEPVYAEVQDRYDLLRVLGEAYFHLGRYEDAENLLARAILLENPDTRSLNLLGLARFQVSDFEGAREAFQRSLTLDAEQPQVEEALTRVTEAERGAQPRPPRDADSGRVSFHCGPQL